MKSCRLTVLAKEILKQPSIDSIVWLLVFTLLKSYNKREQAEQGKIQTVEYKEKGAPGGRPELNPVFKEMNRLKKSLM